MHVSSTTESCPYIVYYTYTFFRCGFPFHVLPLRLFCLRSPVPRFLYIFCKMFYVHFPLPFIRCPLTLYMYKFICIYYIYIIYVYYICTCFPYIARGVRFFCTRCSVYAAPMRLSDVRSAYSVLRYARCAYLN